MNIDSLYTSMEFLAHGVSKLYEFGGWTTYVLLFLLVITQVRAFSLHTELHQQKQLIKKFQGQVGLSTNDFDSDMGVWLNDTAAALRVLFVLVSICPLIGLLGTVIGMTEVFFSMSTYDQSYTTISTGVSEALTSTQLGLASAIPGFIFSMMLKGRQNQNIALVHRVTAHSKNDSCSEPL